MSKLKWGTLIGCAIIGIAIINIVYMMYLTEIPDTKVPNLMGVSQMEAEEILERHQLKSIIAGQRSHASYAPGIVIETKPFPGKRVKINRVIRLFLSKGKASVLMPDIVGRNIEEAKAILDTKKLQLMETKNEFSTEFRHNIILHQTPTPNTAITPSQNIQVIISKGYPVNFKIENNHSGFHKNMENKKITATFYLLNTEKRKEISAFYVINGQSEKIYSKKHQLNNKIQLTFKVKSGGELEVYFDDELKIKKEIKQNEDTSHDGFSPI